MTAPDSNTGAHVPTCTTSNGHPAGKIGSTLVGTCHAWAVASIFAYPGTLPSVATLLPHVESSGR